MGRLGFFSPPDSTLPRQNVDMPALSATDAAETIANSVLFSRAANESGDALQVICAWPVSGQYGTGTRVL